MTSCRLCCRASRKCSYSSAKGAATDTAHQERTANPSARDALAVIVDEEQGGGCLYRETEISYHLCRERETSPCPIPSPNKAEAAAMEDKELGAGNADQMKTGCHRRETAPYHGDAHADGPGRNRAHELASACVFDLRWIEHAA